MIILFKNIPIGTSAHQLASFVEGRFNAYSSETKKLSLSICCIEMLERQDHFCHPVEQYGIIRVAPQSLAKRVVRQLDGCLFDKLTITVREYFVRSKTNDPRLNLIDTHEANLEQRIKDRRAHSLIYSRQI